MGFIDSILDNIALPFEGDALKNKIVLVGDSAGYFDSVSSIVYFSETEVCLAVKKGKIVVFGSGLYIKKFCEGDVVLCGKITKIERS